MSPQEQTADEPFEEPFEYDIPDRITQAEELHQQVRLRAGQIKELKNQFSETKGLFEEMSHMLQEQDELLDRIDVSTESTLGNLRNAHAELVKAEKSQQSGFFSWF